MSTIEERIAAFEEELASIKKLKGIAGPRGPAGDISAAVTNAQREVRDAEGRLALQAVGLSVRLEAEVDAIRKEAADAIKSVQAFVDARIKNAVDGHAVQVLVDYHLLDADTFEPTLAANVTNPANKK